MNYLKVATNYRRILTLERIISDDETTYSDRESLNKEKHNFVKEINRIYKDNRELFEGETVKDIVINNPNDFNENDKIHKEIEISSHNNKTNGSINSSVLSEIDIDQLNRLSLNKLRIVYKDKFIGSKLSKDLILELSNSIIEFRFLKTAGLIK